MINENAGGCKGGRLNLSVIIASLDATSPSRGGLDKEMKLYEMPRAPLLGGLSPQATGGFSRQLLESNPTVIPVGCHRP